jgi:hypothetical protein
MMDMMTKNIKEVFHSGRQTRSIFTLLGQGVCVGFEEMLGSSLYKTCRHCFGVIVWGRIRPIFPIFP